MNERELRDRLKAAEEKTTGLQRQVVEWKEWAKGISHGPVCRAFMHGDRACDCHHSHTPDGRKWHHFIRRVGDPGGNDE